MRLLFGWVPGPLADGTAHLSVVRDEALPQPERLAALLVEMTEQLTVTAADAPLAAPRPPVCWSGSPSG
ncbi:hypothetical protein [Streptomyces sp. NPDC059979]|uniref:hypothetical protein n=1 Tax=unclassified Streptomyces TaxID=2593676 RepID=UPI003650EC1F